MDMYKLFKDNIGKSSAEDSELFCQPCCSDGDWVVAIGYCHNCEEHFCSGCLKVHRKQAMSRNHKILEGEKMPKTQIASMTLDACSDLCVIHTNEIVKYYCSDHDLVGCVDCMVLEHKACKVELIKDISTTYFDGPEHKKLQIKVGNFLKTLEQVNEEIVINEKIMQEVYTKAVDDVKAFRKEIADYLDKAEKDIMSKLNDRRITDESVMSKLRKDRVSIKERIQNLQGKLKLQKNQANELFVAAKYLNEKVTSIDASITQMLTDSRIKSYRFYRSSEISEIVTSMPKLGELLQNIAETEPQCEIEIKALDDTFDCYIETCVLISERQLILIDSDNKCVKLVNVEKQLLSEKYKLRSKPHGVAAVSQNLIAVTLPDEQKLQFLTITHNEKLTGSHEIRLSDTCRSIDCKKDKLILAYEDHVEIRNITGQLIKTLSISDSKESIAFAADAKTFYVSNSPLILAPSVYKYDFEGNVIASYEGNYLSGIAGLHITKDGTVLVGNWQRNGSILMLSPECRKICEIMKHSQHVSYPCSISYCDETRMLFICNYELNMDPKLKNVLKIFQM
ncbi:uncharacterized protein LOC123551264 [Mercenaria mercenaria]|uniref:uncharacterized protein LOC123551264 n=1 Tax=Mercenaria mercenaria TaxID=6596 RepID=UPI00234F74D0|nr:uncharacterized protein LOC123551264 [Mercenaria mercenaria]